MLVIVRAMMSRPKLLLLDEPSLGLAPVIVDQVFEMICALKNSGVTILLGELDLEAHIVRRIGVLERFFLADQALLEVV